MVPDYVLTGKMDFSSRSYDKNRNQTCVSATFSLSRVNKYSRCDVHVLEMSRVPPVPRPSILSPGPLCILNRTVNSCGCQGVDASAVRGNHGPAWVETQTGGPGLSVKEGVEWDGVNLSGIQKRPEDNSSVV